MKTAANSGFHSEMATDAGRNPGVLGHRRPIRFSQSQLRDGTFAAAASERFSQIRTGQGTLVARHFTAGKIAEPHRGYSVVRFDSGGDNANPRTGCRGLRFGGRGKHRLQADPERLLSLIHI